MTVTTRKIDQLLVTSSNTFWFNSHQEGALVKILVDSCARESSKYDFYQRINGEFVFLRTVTE